MAVHALVQLCHGMEIAGRLGKQSKSGKLRFRNTPDTDCCQNRLAVGMNEEVKYSSWLVGSILPIIEVIFPQKENPAWLAHRSQIAVTQEVPSQDKTSLQLLPSTTYRLLIVHHAGRFHMLVFTFFQSWLVYVCQAPSLVFVDQHSALAIMSGFVIALSSFCLSVCPGK